MNKNKIVILHNDVPIDAPADELDNIIETNAVAKILADYGYSVIKIPFTLNQNILIANLKKIKPLFVFNLVETINGDGRLAHFAPALLEHLKIPYTGCNSSIMFLTSTKLLCKEFMLSKNIPTPIFFSEQNFFKKKFAEGTYIIKPIWEDASVGIDADAIKYCGNSKTLFSFLKSREQLLKKECFAEFFINGREFNISIIPAPEKKDNYKILPIAEIVFNNFGKRHKIIDYKAKWDESSFEYKNTIRNFEFNKKDKLLLNKIHKISLNCAQTFNINGYCRIDMRVDENNNPYILEINANPCISPDAGFAAAAEYAGINYANLIKLISLIQT